MKKIKVFWLSNRVQTRADDRSTGGWLTAMANALIDTGGVEIANVSRGKVTQVTRQDCGPISQWVIPVMKSNPRSPLPSKEILKDLEQAVNDYAPDLIHVWGTEDIWGLLTARKYLQPPALLEMQGLKSAIAQVYHGGLSTREQLSCIGLKEVLKRYSIFNERRDYQNWSSIDQEMIQGHDYVTVQTEWMEAQVKAINSRCKTFRSNCLLRGIFYQSATWHYSGRPIVFCSAAYPSPFKGLHVVIRALAVLKNQFPDIQLHIAGELQRQGIRQEGYVGWLNREVKQLGLEANIKWLGALSASQMVEESRSASVSVLPSYIENCSNLMQEGMVLGIPMAVSYVGGLPSLAKDEESALFFSPGDAVMCAHQITRLITDRPLAERISRQARETGLERNDFNKIVQNQVETYRQVINETH